jgi:hypothetical protein
MLNVSWEDTMPSDSTSKTKDLDLDFHALLNEVRLDAMRDTGYEWHIAGSCNRTIKEQHGLYIKAKDGIDNDKDGLIDEADEKVTCADGGQSPHNFGCATDLCPVDSHGDFLWNAPKSVWKIMADIAVSKGLTAGFYFKSLYDAPHIEHPKWRQLRADWKAGKIEIA